MSYFNGLKRKAKRLLVGGGSDNEFGNIKGFHEFETQQLVKNRTAVRNLCKVYQGMSQKIVETVMGLFVKFPDDPMKEFMKGILDNIRDMPHTSSAYVKEILDESERLLTKMEQKLNNLLLYVKAKDSLYTPFCQTAAKAKKLSAKVMKQRANVVSREQRVELEQLEKRLAEAEKMMDQAKNDYQIAKTNLREEVNKYLETKKFVLGTIAQLAFGQMTEMLEGVEKDLAKVEPVLQKARDFDFSIHREVRHVLPIYDECSDTLPISNIIPGLIYLGNCDGAAAPKLLRTHGIRAVVNCSTEVENFYPDKFSYFNIPVCDMESQNIFEHFDNFYDIMGSGQGPFFVHCVGGISRSTTLVISYLMKKKKMRFYDSYLYVRQRRRVVYPNEGFVKQLLHFEKLLFGNVKDSKPKLILPKGVTVVQVQDESEGQTVRFERPDDDRKMDEDTDLLEVKKMKEQTDQRFFTYSPAQKLDSFQKDQSAQDQAPNESQLFQSLKSTHQIFESEGLKLQEPGSNPGASMSMSNRPVEDSLEEDEMGGPAVGGSEHLGSGSVFRSERQFYQLDQNDGGYPDMNPAPRPPQSSFIDQPQTDPGSEIAGGLEALLDRRRKFEEAPDPMDIGPSKEESPYKMIGMEPSKKNIIDLDMDSGLAPSAEDVEVRGDGERNAELDRIKRRREERRKKRKERERELLPNKGGRPSNPLGKQAEPKKVRGILGLTRVKALGPKKQPAQRQPVQKQPARSVKNNISMFEKNRKPQGNPIPKKQPAQRQPVQKQPARSVKNNISMFENRKPQGNPIPKKDNTRRGPPGKVKRIEQKGGSLEEILARKAQARKKVFTEMGDPENPVQSHSTKIAPRKKQAPISRPEKKVERQPRVVKKREKIQTGGGSLQEILARKRAAREKKFSGLEDPTTPIQGDVESVPTKEQPNEQGKQGGDFKNMLMQHLMGVNDSPSQPKKVPVTKKNPVKSGVKRPVGGGIKKRPVGMVKKTGRPPAPGKGNIAKKRPPAPVKGKRPRGGGTNRGRRGAATGGVRGRWQPNNKRQPAVKKVNRMPPPPVAGKITKRVMTGGNRSVSDVRRRFENKSSVVQPTPVQPTPVETVSDNQPGSDIGDDQFDQDLLESERKIREYEEQIRAYEEKMKKKKMGM